MIFTAEDEPYHNVNNICPICRKLCMNKVRDHCHETGKYRGPACNICTLDRGNTTTFLLYSIMALAIVSIYYLVNYLNIITIRES